MQIYIIKAWFTQHALQNSKYYDATFIKNISSTIGLKHDNEKKQYRKRKEKEVTVQYMQNMAGLS